VWRLSLAGGDTLEAEVLVPACGQLSRPARPPIAGLDRFSGPVFHSAEWDHDVDLTGKRVAVIGTGASAIQFVPATAGRVSALTVFQRSAPYLIPKPDRTYGARHRAFLRAGPSHPSSHKSTYAELSAGSRTRLGNGRAATPRPRGRVRERRTGPATATGER
jgi:cation diffusion facilitator CzcD-associated flavoprotein CzcO